MNKIRARRTASYGLFIVCVGSARARFGGKGAWERLTCGGVCRRAKKGCAREGDTACAMLCFGGFGVTNMTALVGRRDGRVGGRALFVWCHDVMR